MFDRARIGSHEFRKSAPPRRRVPLEVSRLEGRVLMTGSPDTTAPGTAVEYSGVYGGDGYYKSPVTLTFTGKDADDASDTLRTYVSVNGGPTEERNSVTLNGDGTYNVAYYSIDPAGNREYTEHQVVHIDRTPPALLAYAQPTVLWPPNHKFVPVTVTGLTGDWTSGPVRHVSYHVYDEYHRIQPKGTADVDIDGRYRFVVNLQASRLGRDHDGRLYRIAVTAYDNAGNITTATPYVVVPHDMGHNQTGRGGQGGQGHPRGHRNPVPSHRPFKHGQAKKHFATPPPPEHRAHGPALNHGRAKKNLAPLPVVANPGHHIGANHGNGHGDGNGANHGKGHGNGKKK